jgi:hypothetical protein
VLKSHGTAHHHPAVGVGHMPCGTILSAFGDESFSAIHKSESLVDAAHQVHTVSRNARATKPLRFVIAYFVQFAADFMRNVCVSQRASVMLEVERTAVCFSATVNFVGSGVLGAVGVVTLSKVKHRREVLFAALPTLFAVHQFIEGFVWLGLDGILSPAVAHDMGAAFMLYAQGFLPFLLPLSVLLFEPNRTSRQRMLPFLVLGGATTLYILWALTAFPLQLYIRGNSIVYINQATNNLAAAVLYVIATCGSLFFSKIKMMVIFGAANLVIILVVMGVKRYAFTSLWCAYAAVASVIILAYFWRSHPSRPFVYA